ncbi:hypothetical protein EX895_004399 [Sporisorium graminicola]|uniref:Uncharacterized protein n=1 Tax=Sporisorium graminicola TaxID=280036 RepID=A0A4V6ETH9_9BASI|nr:hypothetical protein EX895_004399 [Sporisorium graminicola]TKY86759.1 hypothetical protein EX895_004399 [Sporisorium graminicola]
MHAVLFFDAKKNPITVNLSKKGDKLRDELEAAIKATTFLQNKGSCATIKIGYMASHTPEQLAENVVAALPAVLSRVKGGWENVHNIDVKTGNSAALPVWNAKLGVKTHVTPSSPAAKRGLEVEEKEAVQTPSKKTAVAKSPVKKVQEEESSSKVKSPSPRKTRSAAVAKAGAAIEQAATPVNGTPKKTASSISRSARKVK